MADTSVEWVVDTPSVPGGLELVSAMAAEPDLDPEHDVVRKPEGLGESGEAQEPVSDWLQLLYEQALLAEGRPVPDPQDLARCMTCLMNSATGDEEGAENA